MKRSCAKPYNGCTPSGTIVRQSGYSIYLGRLEFFSAFASLSHRSYSCVKYVVLGGGQGCRTSQLFHSQWFWTRRCSSIYRFTGQHWNPHSEVRMGYRLYISSIVVSVGRHVSGRHRDQQRICLGASHLHGSTYPEACKHFL